MTTLHVIILAQGQQSRLPDLAVPKQLLEIPGVGETILRRTFRLLGELAPPAFPTLVGHYGLADAVGVVHPTTRDIGGVAHARSFWFPSLPGVHSSAMLLTLHNPGNHAVAGLQQALRLDAPPPDAEVAVLLGDVIYSRAALRAVLFESQPEAWEKCEGVTFVGTPDLSAGGGEIFGIRVTGKRLDVLLAPMPKTSTAFTTYQPGQLRELLWTFQKRIGLSHDLRVHRRSPYIPITDFTTDIDTPADLARLPEIGRAVAAERS